MNSSYTDVNYMLLTSNLTFTKNYKFFISLWLSYNIEDAMKSNNKSMLISLVTKFNRIHILFCLKVSPFRTSLVVQWLRLYTLSAEGKSSILDQRTRILHAAWHGQKNNNN